MDYCSRRPKGLYRCYCRTTEIPDKFFFRTIVVLEVVLNNLHVISIVVKRLNENPPQY